MAVVGIAATIGRPFITNLGALSFTSRTRTIILTSFGAEILKPNSNIIRHHNKTNKIYVQFIRKYIYNSFLFTKYGMTVRIF